MFNETEIKQIGAIAVLLAATKCTKFVFGRASASDPAAGAHDAPRDRLVGWVGDTPSPFPSPRRLRLRRLDSHAFGVRLGALGASLPAFRHFFFHSLSTACKRALSAYMTGSSCDVLSCLHPQSHPVSQRMHVTMDKHLKLSMTLKAFSRHINNILS